MIHPLDRGLSVLEGLLGTDPERRRAALETARTHVDPLWDRALRRIATTDSDPHARTRAQECLDGARQGLLETAPPPPEADPASRARWARSLAFSGDPAAAGALLKAARRESHPDALAALLPSLACVAGARAVSALSAPLSHEAPEVRRCAVIALASLADAAALSRMTALCDDPDPLVRDAATRVIKLFGLGGADGPDGEDLTVAGLIDRARADRLDPATLRTQLESARDPRALEELLGAAHRSRLPDRVALASRHVAHADVGVRRAVAEVLAGNPGKAAADLLAVMVRDRNAGINQAALQALLDRTPAEARAALRDELTPNPIDDRPGSRPRRRSTIVSPALESRAATLSGAIVAGLGLVLVVWLVPSGRDPQAPTGAPRPALARVTQRSQVVAARPPPGPPPPLPAVRSSGAFRDKLIDALRGQTLPTLDQVMDQVRAEMGGALSVPDRFIRMLALRRANHGHRPRQDMARNALRARDPATAMRELETALTAVHPDHLYARAALLKLLLEATRKARDPKATAQVRKRLEAVGREYRTLWAEAARASNIPAPQVEAALAAAQAREATRDQSASLGIVLGVDNTP